MPRGPCEQEIRNYFVAAGLNSIGILNGGGLGGWSPSTSIRPRYDPQGTGILA